jgi:hypothetical protein
MPYTDRYAGVTGESDRAHLHYYFSLDDVSAWLRHYQPDVICYFAYYASFIFFDTRQLILFSFSLRRSPSLFTP